MNVLLIFFFSSFLFYVQEDELTILDVRKFKPIHRLKFNYEVIFNLTFHFRMKFSWTHYILNLAFFR